MSEYEKDKWYKSLYGKFILDRKAAEAMGRDVSDMPSSIDFFEPLGPVVKQAVVPKVSKAFTLGSQWNYPMLIEAFEKANPDLKFSRADVRALLKSKKITVKDCPAGRSRLSQEEFVNIIENPETLGQQYIRQYWVKDGKLNLDILTYFGLDERLVRILKEGNLPEHSKPWSQEESTNQQDPITLTDLATHHQKFYPV